ncbi:hypothetical protein [Pseudomonas aeruginosa]|uniref:hypothetical protein n=1 Tax=Pseudomonas aeruginosa TaxID=287 RepID=UPI002118B5E4|nr:hypothetical protein [Pseudomonas aeruginosa]
MQERHGLPLRSFSSGKALTAGRAARPEVAQERRYLQGAPLGLELPGRIALRDPHCAWQWFEPEAAAEAFPAAHWLAAFLVLLGRYGNEEITLGFPEPITVRGRQAPALLRSAYRAMESSAERSARLAEELDDARRQLSADGQERAALAGCCAVQALAARPTASSPGWLAWCWRRTAASAWLCAIPSTTNCGVSPAISRAWRAAWSTPRPASAGCPGWTPTKSAVCRPCAASPRPPVARRTPPSVRGPGAAHTAAHRRARRRP